MDIKIDKKQEYKAQIRLDNTDRIEVERFFSNYKPFAINGSCLFPFSFYEGKLLNKEGKRVLIYVLFF